jgi:hypothetical protein
MSDYIPYNGPPSGNRYTFRQFFCESNVLTETIDNTLYSYSIFVFIFDIKTSQIIRIGFCKTKNNAITVGQTKRAIGDENARVYIDLDKDQEKIIDFCLNHPNKKSGPFIFGVFEKKKRGPKAKTEEIQVSNTQIMFNKECASNRSDEHIVSTERNFKTEVYYVWGNGNMPKDYAKEMSGYNKDPSTVSVVRFEKNGNDVIYVRGYRGTDIVIIPHLDPKDIKYRFLCELCGDMPMDVSTDYRVRYKWVPKIIWFYNGVPPQNLVPPCENFTTFKHVITKEIYINDNGPREVVDIIDNKYVCCCEKNGKKCMNDCRYEYGPCAACELWINKNNQTLPRWCKNYQICGNRVMAGKPMSTILCDVCRIEGCPLDTTNIDSVQRALPNIAYNSSCILKCRVIHKCVQCNKNIVIDPGNMCSTCYAEVEKYNDDYYEKHIGPNGDGSYMKSLKLCDY